MLQLQRQKELMELLRAHKNLSVKELSAALFASTATVRRDLAALEKEGLLRRSFGGAVLAESFPDQLPLPLRAAEHLAQKKKIASRAAECINPGDTVFLDASSTTYFLCPHLTAVPGLTVITNSPCVCTELASLHVRTFCTGGELLQGSVALCGSDAERYVSDIRADACFFSARGYAGGLLSDSSKAERDIKRAMLEHTKRRYCLCDTSKAELSFPYVIIRESELDSMITDL